MILGGTQNHLEAEPLQPRKEIFQISKHRQAQHLTSSYEEDIQMQKTLLQEETQPKTQDGFQGKWSASKEVQKETWFIEYSGNLQGQKF